MARKRRRKNNHPSANAKHASAMRAGAMLCVTAKRRAGASVLCGVATAGCKAFFALADLELALLVKPGSLQQHHDTSSR